MTYLESETVSRLKAAGYDFTQYLNPVPVLPEYLVGPVSSVLDDEEDEGGEE